MNLKPLAESLLLFSRLQAMVNDPLGQVRFQTKISNLFYKPHVSYLVFNNKNKLMFIVTGEYLMMSGMKIDVPRSQHKKILELATQRHRTEKLQAKAILKENSSTKPVVKPEL